MERKYSRILFPSSGLFEKGEKESCKITLKNNSRLSLSSFSVFSSLKINFN